MNITETLITEVKLNAQIIIEESVELEDGKKGVVAVLATVTREARDAGIERFVKLLAVDGAGDEHKVIGWRDDYKIKVISF